MKTIKLSAALFACCLGLLTSTAKAETVIHDAVGADGSSIVSDVTVGYLGNVERPGFVALPNYNGEKLSSLSIILRITDGNGVPVQSVSQVSSIGITVQYFNSFAAMLSNPWGLNGPLTSISYTAPQMTGLSAPYYTNLQGQTYFKVGISLGGFEALGVHPAAIGSTPVLKLRIGTAGGSYRIFTAGTNYNGSDPLGDYIGNYNFAIGIQTAPVAPFQSYGFPFKSLAVIISTTSVANSCVGDLNGDGLVDDSDFVLFSAAYNKLDCADPTMPAGCPSDLNRDGVVDDSDFVSFAQAYNQLVCQ